MKKTIKRNNIKVPAYTGGTTTTSSTKTGGSTPGANGSAAGDGLTAAQVGAIGQGAVAAGGMLANSLFGTSTATTSSLVAAQTAGDIFGGIGKGASIGAAFGPWGAAIGGAIGGVVGSIGLKGREAEMTSFTDYDLGTLGTGLMGAFGANRRLRRERNRIKSNAYANRAAVEGTENLAYEFAQENTMGGVNSFKDGGQVKKPVYMSSPYDLMGGGQEIATDTKEVGYNPQTGEIKINPKYGKEGSDLIHRIAQPGEYWFGKLVNPETGNTFKEDARSIIKKGEVKGARAKFQDKRTAEINKEFVLEQLDVLADAQNRVHQEQNTKPKVKRSVLAGANGMQVPAYNKGVVLTPAEIALLKLLNNKENVDSVYGNNSPTKFSDTPIGLFFAGLTKVNKPLTTADFSYSMILANPELYNELYYKENPKAKDELKRTQSIKPANVHTRVVLSEDPVTTETNVVSKSAPAITNNNGNKRSILNPYAFNSDITQFKYWDKEKNDYTDEYKKWVNGLTQQDVDDIIAGKYGDMSTYLKANPNFKMNVETAKRLMLDKKYGDWHKFSQNYVDSKVDYSEPIDPYSKEYILARAFVDDVADQFANKYGLNKTEPIPALKKVTDPDGDFEPEEEVIKYTKPEKDYSWIGDLAGAIGQLAVAIPGLGAEPEVEDAVYNPYHRTIMDSMRDRRARLVEGAMADNARERAMGNYNLTRTGANTGRNLAAMTQSAVNAADAIAKVRLQEDNANNQYRGEEAEILNNLGQQWVNATNLARTNNAQNRAAALMTNDAARKSIHNILAGSTKSYNTKLRDKQLLPLYRRFLEAGFTHEDLAPLYS